MCKFFILGCCSRGDNCHFAHDKAQLQPLPNLSRTKLCRTLINTGQCDNPDCRYAHNKVELRDVPGFSGPWRAPTKEDEDPDGAPLQREEEWQRAAAAPLGMPAAPFQVGADAPTAFQSQFAMLQQQMADAAGADLAKRAALLQMGQAAQAHAVEAVRLQAMAACLQAQGGTPGEANAAGCFPGAFPHPGMFGYSGEELNLAGLLPPPTPGGAATTPGSGLSMGWSSASNSGAVGGGATRSKLAPNAASARQVSGAAPTYFSVNEGGSSPLPAERVRSFLSAGEPGGAPFPASEPVQINPGSLRSLSSNSLTGLDPLAEEEPENAFAERAAAQFAALNASNPANAGNDQAGMKLTSPPIRYTVKNTFLDFEGQRTPVAKRLRNVVSCAGRLDALAEHYDSEEMPTDSPVALHQLAEKGPFFGAVASPTAHQGGVATGAEPTEKRSQDTPLVIQPAGSLVGDGAGQGHPGSGEPLLNGDIGAGLTVKNTFLDFAEEAKNVGLRSVQTAAGRLDMMGQEWQDS